ARVGGLHIAGVLQLGEQSRSAASRQRGELVAVDDAGPVVGPRRGERRVDAEPFGDRARRAFVLQEIANRDEREPAIPEVGYEAQTLDVLRAVDRVTAVLGGLGQQALRLVPADGPGRQAAPLDHFLEWVLLFGRPRLGLFRRHGSQSTTGRATFAVITA